MSANQENENNTENEMAEEPSVTMLDILEQEKELEEESAAVLGGSDEKCCTYAQGYIKRQALYSCLTCSPDARTDQSKSAGICLACSYQCHENHELIELYTKRDFRCDCPTDRIIGKKCAFASTVNETVDNQSGGGGGFSGKVNLGFNKMPINDQNVYNQNFCGLYCVCHRPYPDPDDPIQDEMIQCIGCEDWYHTRHLNIVGDVPKTTEYSEMICGACMQNYKILNEYVGLAVNKIEKLQPDGDNVQTDIDIVTDDTKSESNDDKLKSDLNQSISNIMNMPNDDDLTTAPPITESNKANEENPDEPAAKRIKIDHEDETEKACKRPTLNHNYKKGAIFWPSDWRTMLCKCLKCTEVYVEQKASFLLDPEDTVQFYEENGLKKDRESDYDRGIRALSAMEHTQQIDAITGYNQMKDKLKEYLQTFVVSNKIVTEEDINTFFQGMKNDKKNSKAGNQPHFCR